MGAPSERVRAILSEAQRRADDRGVMRTLYAGRTREPLERQREHLSDEELQRIIGRLETIRAFHPRIKDRRVGCGLSMILGTAAVWGTVGALRALWPGGGWVREAIWVCALILLPAVIWRVRRQLPVSALPEEIVKVMQEFGRCAACAYLIRDLTPEADGCTVCPECGAAWRINT